jgi:hypothetical protein
MMFRVVFWYILPLINANEIIFTLIITEAHLALKHHTMEVWAGHVGKDPHLYTKSPQYRIAGRLQGPQNSFFQELNFNVHHADSNFTN